MASNIYKKNIRRNEAYFKHHKFLITETENGTISQEETVRMIPPLLLDIKSHYKILDMCAAPGSKTAQIIGTLHGESNDVLPTGYVIANDIDNKRCYMLVHQAKRLNSPCVAVINHDSTILPNLLEDDGDRTLRKNPDIWMKWTPAKGLHQHMIQLRILRCGIELVSVGGRVVYSTCSLNPIENEAETNGAVELVDMNNFLPTLNHSPGLNTWLVGNKFLDFNETFDNVPEKWRTVIRSPILFQEGLGRESDLMDTKKIHLSFSKKEKKLAQEGLESIFPFIERHCKINIPKDGLIKLLLNDNPDKNIKSFSEEIQKQVENLSLGSCILTYTEENSKGGKPLVLHIIGLRGPQSLQCYKSLPSMVHFLCILKSAFSKYFVKKFKKSEEKAIEISNTTDGEDMLIKKE
ncbi:hypothetical protein FQA39_LY11721 [Lamprigera yunnana]|nr:hypothetical protein FQA39_LY11721 [Lamprigera yunnana]